MLRRYQQLLLITYAGCYWACGQNSRPGLMLGSDGSVHTGESDVVAPNIVADGPLQPIEAQEEGVEEFPEDGGLASAEGALPPQAAVVELRGVIEVGGGVLRRCDETTKAWKALFYGEARQALSGTLAQEEFATCGHPGSRSCFFYLAGRGAVGAPGEFEPVPQPPSAPPTDITYRTYDGQVAFIELNSIVAVDAASECLDQD